jgi:hypothetical protein
MPGLEERKLSFRDGRLNIGSTGALVSVNKRLQRAITAAAERGLQSSVCVEPWQTEARIRMAPRFLAAISDGVLRDVLQNGDVK